MTRFLLNFLVPLAVALIFVMGICTLALIIWMAWQVLA